MSRPTLRSVKRSAREYDRFQRDGHWIRPEQVIAPVRPAPIPAPPTTTMGCVCPAGAEKTCQGPLCPRRSTGSPS